jgi:RNA polymerase sigma-70 factor, ECF subfamily
MQPLLRLLSEADREALTLIDVQQVTQVDAARQLGLSVSGMKSRIQRARHRLKTVVEECCRVQLDRRGGVIAYERRGTCGCNTSANTTCKDKDTEPRS